MNYRLCVQLMQFQKIIDRQFIALLTEGCKDLVITIWISGYTLYQDCPQIFYGKEGKTIYSLFYLTTEPRNGEF